MQPHQWRTDQNSYFHLQSQLDPKMPSRAPPYLQPYLAGQAEADTRAQASSAPPLPEADHMVTGQEERPLPLEPSVFSDPLSLKHRDYGPRNPFDHAHYPDRPSRPARPFPGPLTTDWVQPAQGATSSTGPDVHHRRSGLNQLVQPGSSHDPAPDSDRCSILPPPASLLSNYSTASIPSRLNTKSMSLSHLTGQPSSDQKHPTSFIQSPNSPHGSTWSGSTQNLISPGAPAPPSATSSTLANERYRLYLREPNGVALAARPSNDKDNRPVDPPIILQLQIMDFNPESSEDMSDLQYAFWVIHCHLFPSDKRVAAASDDVRQNLFGKCVASPEYLERDPDPDTAVPYPTSDQSLLRFPPESYRKYPVTLFIFDHLCIRQVGEYRLKFSLMKVTPDSTVPGATLPILSTVWSDPVRVYNPPDFTRVQRSTPLFNALALLPNRGLKRRNGPEAREKRKQELVDQEMTDR